MWSNPGQPWSVVYFGTPEYAVPALQALSGDGRFDVRLVVTQPDRQAGRGHRLSSPPVKLEAERLGLPCYQLERLRTPEDRAPLEAVHADVFVVAAYGVIFGPKTLALPRFGCVNLHASLLPVYRGASPISAAIASGDGETGVCLMKMEKGLDTGPVIACASTLITTGDTTAGLTARLSQTGAELLIAKLPGFLEGTILPEAQDDDLASIVRPMVKNDGWIDWMQPAERIGAHVRAMWPWPRAWTTIDNQVVQIHAALPAPGDASFEPGQFSVEQGKMLVGTGAGPLILETVQPTGKSAMHGLAYANGRGGGGSFDLTESPPIPGPLIRLVRD